MNGSGLLCMNEKVDWSENIDEWKEEEAKRIFEKEEETKRIFEKEEEAKRIFEKEDKREGERNC